LPAGMTYPICAALSTMRENGNFALKKAVCA